GGGQRRRRASTFRGGHLGVDPGRWPEDRPEREEPARSVRHDRPVYAGDALENRRGDPEQARIAQEVVQRLLPAPRRSHARLRQQVAGRNDVPPRRRIVEDDEQRPPTVLGEIQGDGEQTFRDLLVPGGVPPGGVLLACIGQPPASVEEAEDLPAVREDL